MPPTSSGRFRGRSRRGAVPATGRVSTEWSRSSRLARLRTAGVAGVRRSGLAQGQIASGHESAQASLDGAAVEQDMPGAFPAAQPDVGPEPVDEPLLASARVRSPQTDDVAEAKLDDFRPAGGHYDNSSWRDAIASPITGAQSIRARGTRRGYPAAALGRPGHHPAGVRARPRVEAMLKALAAGEVGRR